MRRLLIHPFRTQFTTSFKVLAWMVFVVIVAHKVCSLKLCHETHMKEMLVFIANL